MSAEQLKSILNVEFMGLPNKFDPEFTPSPDMKKTLEELTGVAARDIFSAQKVLDRAKKDLTKAQFRTLLAAYFAQFIGSQGFDVRRLERELKERPELFRRHLGKDWHYFLTTMIRMFNEVDRKKIEKPRGLLQIVT